MKFRSALGVIGACALICVIYLWSIGRENASRDAAQQNMPASARRAADDFDFEEHALRLLSDGDQPAAEKYLAEQAQRFPELVRSALLFRQNKPLAAAAVIEPEKDYREAQRIFFLAGACWRSRFDVETARPFFQVVCAMRPSDRTTECCGLILQLDSDEWQKGHILEVTRAFGELRALADENPGDIIIRWMVAVQCRAWNMAGEGVKHYGLVREIWDPGPAVLHQTYANLLDELERHDEALVERRLAVLLEPSGWSYDGLGCTLDYLQQFELANEAHKKAVESAPMVSNWWSNWAIGLNKQGRYDEAIVLCERALALDRSYWKAYWTWGQSLEGKQDPEAALAKYEKALVIYPANPYLEKKIAELKSIKQPVAQ